MTPNLLPPLGGDTEADSGNHQLLVTLDQLHCAAELQVCSGISVAAMNYSPPPSSNTLAAAYVTAAAQLMTLIMSVILFGSIMMQRLAEYS